ncbi:hypothetical protein BCV71DRAFT_274988 [Rhizopus microsporus]|uniref:Cas12f1-like TNB domain-containing protein n=1 Tax=Rhizopus microsporus TaxID=58291 RepID=A0A1X0RS15_RHIZD|nr:hypothetical protein BCV71DRAFT_274988 [Rhizopus microsporus]
MTGLSVATFPFFLYFNMKRKKDDDPPHPKAKRNKRKGIRRSRVPFFVCTNASKFIQLMLKTYINKQKGTQEIVKRLFDNSKKYDTSSTVGAKNQSPNKKTKRKCKQSNGGTEFVSVDEYLTSQICNKCKSKKLNNISITGSKRRVHSVLKCESCGTAWNRDVNSTLNIYNIFVYKSKHDNESPPPFQKTFKRLTVLPGFNALSITAVHSLTPR